MGMTSNVYIEFGITALSILNGILLLWLGLTVWLNAQSRGWGLWLAALGLLLGSVFFILHSTIISAIRELFWINNMLWWPAAWGMVIFLPLAWYVDILWYTGYWNLNTVEHPSLQHTKRIHRNGIIILIGLLIIMGALLLSSEPFRMFLQGERLHMNFVLTSINIHIFFWVYAIFIFQCMVLSVYALRFPVPSGRLMGDEARKRALPYFMGASISLFLVTFVVIIIFFWLESQMRMDYHIEQSIEAAAIFDLIINGLILSSVLFIGQAVSSYEVYTGETLPRKGLLRHWRRIILLGVVFSGFAGIASVINLRSIYVILFYAVFMVIFFATMTWRLFEEREYFMKQLRPFVNSQQLFRQSLHHVERDIYQDIDNSALEQTLTTIFDHLCREILHTSFALLAADSGFLSIREFSLIFPAEHEKTMIQNPILAWQITLNDKNNLIEAFHISEQPLICWAVPLWNEVGRIGYLFLGEKADGSLYTHEEIEIARSACERVLDTQASAEMTRQLMFLQREQLTNSQITDQRARQLLHDEFLPDVQAILIELANPEITFELKQSLMDSLQSLHKKLSKLLYDLPATYAPEITRDRFLDAIKKLPELSNNESFSKIIWTTQDEAIRQVETLPIQIREVLYFAVREAIRNAAHYGKKNDSLENHFLEISISTGVCLEIAIKDFGGGIDVDQITNDNMSTGRTGKGLSIHQTMLAIIGGNLTVESMPGNFTKVNIRMPIIK